MAISLIGSTMAGALNGGNVTITLPGTYSSGDVAVVNVTLGTSKATVLSVASSSGAAYTQIVTTIVSSLVRFGVFRQVIPSTGYTQFTVTGAGGSTDSTCSIVHIFTGVDQTTPEDVTATSTTGNSATPDSPSITVASCSDAIVTSVGWSVSARLLTAPTSFSDALTEQSSDTRPAQAGQAWITNATTSAFDPASWTSTGAASGWCAATIALKPFVLVSSAEQWAAIMAGPDISSSVVDEARRVVVRSYR